MSQSRIHITAIASAARDAVTRLGIQSAKGLVELVQRAIGDQYRVTANERMIFAREVDPKGGRFDDHERIREVETVLADDNVAALVTLRGGAWFTRILDRINWDVLRRRQRKIYIFGFSEMTSLIAIAGRYPQVVGLYDLGPGFLYGGLKGWALSHLASLTDPVKMSAEEQQGFAAGWAAARYRIEFEGFFREVVDIIEGRGSPRVPSGYLLAGTLPARKRITITGGNLSLLAALVGSSFLSAIETRGKWLAIEDINEPADRMDRMIASLQLAGLLDRTEGIIIGDFHNDKDGPFSRAAFEILKYHLPRKKLPIIMIENFGHIYPIAPLPMHRQVTLCCHRGRDKQRVTIEIPWRRWAQSSH